jgi:hypothetical protein
MKRYPIGFNTRLSNLVAIFLEKITIFNKLFCKITIMPVEQALTLANFAIVRYIRTWIVAMLILIAQRPSTCRNG